MTSRVRPDNPSQGPFPGDRARWRGADESVRASSYQRGGGYVGVVLVVNRTSGACTGWVKSQAVTASPSSPSRRQHREPASHGEPGGL